MSSGIGSCTSLEVSATKSIRLISSRSTSTLMIRQLLTRKTVATNVETCHNLDSLNGRRLTVSEMKSMFYRLVFHAHLCMELSFSNVWFTFSESQQRKGASRSESQFVLDVLTEHKSVELHLPIRSLYRAMLHQDTKHLLRTVPTIRASIGLRLTTQGALSVRW